MALISGVQANNNTYNLRSTAILEGTIDSSSTSSALKATVPKLSTLEQGVICLITNTVTSLSNGATLNVNNLGAKPIYDARYFTTINQGVFEPDSACLFSYDEDNWNNDGCWIIYPNPTDVQFIATLDNNGLLTITNVTYVSNADTTSY